MCMAKFSLTLVPQMSFSTFVALVPDHGILSVEGTWGRVNSLINFGLIAKKINWIPLCTLMVKVSNISLKS